MPGTWDVLTNPPGFAASSMLLLTDGRVICQEANSVRWFALSPDTGGSYKNGTWSAIASAATPRLYYASAVLADGRVFVAGGEYAPNSGDDTNSVEIYDPVANTWTQVAPPTGWDHIGDAPCSVLADGRVLLGDINNPRSVIYDPVANAWTATGPKGDVSSEETWTLLRDGSVLTVDCNPPFVNGVSTMATQRFIPVSNSWVDSGSTQVDLVDHGFSTEIGPAVLLADGRVIAFGGSGHTAIYTPPSNGSGGAWTPGPDLPDGPDHARMTVRDAPACLLPNGKVLCCAGLSTGWGGTTNFFEFHPDTATLMSVAAPVNYDHDPYHGRMLLLPTGQVLYVADSNVVAIYTPDGHHSERTEPVVISDLDDLLAGATYHVVGKRFNGMSQAVSYGDDYTAATNYPLARLEYEDGRVVYCRTHRHSTMAVATGHATVSTHVEIPFSAPGGEARFSIIANGVPSDGVEVEVHPAQWWTHGIPWAEVWQLLIGSLADGNLIVIGPDGRPHPVPPWGPDELREAAARALGEVVEGLNDLMQAGRQLQDASFAAAAQRADKLSLGGPSGAARPREPVGARS